jgi:hypothetical protein
MSYTINTFDGSVLTTVNDGTINQTLDINLIGRNYAGYGDPQNENFVFLLENFARDIEPPAAIRGQIWFDTASKRLKVYTGDQVNGAKVWKTAGGLEYSAIQPSNSSLGDMWFDTVAGQLKVWATISNTTAWLPIGPAMTGNTVTQMVSKQLRGFEISDVGHSVPIMYYTLLATVNNNVVYVISNNEFIIDSSDQSSLITGFSHIRKGLTLPYVSESTGNYGQSTNGYIYWGSASDANRLGGIAADQYVLKSNASFNAVVHFSDDGYYLGNNNDLLVNIDKSFVTGVSTPSFANKTGPNILFKVTSNGNLVNPMNIYGESVRPGIDSHFTLGTVSAKWDTVWANHFNGIASHADMLLVAGQYQSAAVTAAANTVVSRDSTGNITANQFNGVATSAKYADLAEKYLADADYEVGTVMMVGGEKEVTASQKGYRAVGVVSGKPAFRMNEDLVGGTFVALKGRVPVKTLGKVKKGDRLVAVNNGCAQVLSMSTTADCVFAIALESSDDVNLKFVEAVIL